MLPHPYFVVSTCQIFLGVPLEPACCWDADRFQVSIKHQAQFIASLEPNFFPFSTTFERQFFFGVNQDFKVTSNMLDFCDQVWPPNYPDVSQGDRSEADPGSAKGAGGWVGLAWHHPQRRLRNCTSPSVNSSSRSKILSFWDRNIQYIPT